MLIIGGHRDSLSSLITHCPFGRANFLWWWTVDYLRTCYFYYLVSNSNRAVIGGNSFTNESHQLCADSGFEPQSTIGYQPHLINH